MERRVGMAGSARCAAGLLGSQERRVLAGTLCGMRSGSYTAICTC